MKKIFNCLLVFTIFSCSLGSLCSNEIKTDNSSVISDTIVVTKIDTVWVVDNNYIDSLANCLKSAQDSIIFYRDSIRYEDYNNARRIEKIKYYIKICENNSKNKQFFYGWIKRTMSE